MGGFTLSPRRRRIVVSAGWCGMMAYCLPLWSTRLASGNNARMRLSLTRTDLASAITMHELAMSLFQIHADMFRAVERTDYANVAAGGSDPADRFILPCRWHIPWRLTFNREIDAAVASVAIEARCAHAVLHRPMVIALA